MRNFYLIESLLCLVIFAMYVTDDGSGKGIRKIDAKTGVVSTFITGNGGTTTNLPAASTMPINPTMAGTVKMMTFDKNRMLYVASVYTERVINSTVIYLERRGRQLHKRNTYEWVGGHGHATFKCW